MAIKLNTGLDIRTSLPVDKRFLLTKTEMLEMQDGLMPSKYFAICYDDGNIYIYDKINEIDPLTGKFRPASAEVNTKIAQIETQLNNCVAKNDYESFKNQVETIIQQTTSDLNDVKSQLELTGKKLSLTLDESNYQVIAKLLNSDNTVLSQAVVDLPIEDLINNIYYDSTKKSLIVNLVDATKKEIYIGDLIQGLATQASVQTVENKIPKNLSQLNNDMGFLREHQSLAAYRTAQEQNVIDFGKQDKLVAGENVKIENNVISATGSEPEDYIKTATKVDNELVLTKKDDTVVVYSPDVDKAYVDQAIEDVEAEIPSLDGYATEEWVENKGYLTEHQSLVDYALISETGNKINLELDEETYTLTATLYDKNDNLISTSNVIDLPLEELVVNIEFDNDTKELIITLKNGVATRVPISSIVSGLATQQWVQDQGYLTEHQDISGKADKSYVDTELAKKANTADIPSLDGYATEEWVGNEISTLDNTLSDVAKSGSYNDLSDKPTIPEIPENVSAFNNDVGYLTEHQDISGKANVGDSYTKSESDTKYATNDDLNDYPTTLEMNQAIGAHHDSSKVDVDTLNNYYTKDSLYTKAEVNSALNNKQDKLTAGTNVTIQDNIISAVDTKYTAGDNITISEENVISADTSGKLTSDLVTNVTVGGIQAGTTFIQGTTLETILRQLLYMPPALQSIYVDTLPTRTSYSSGDLFNPAGMVIKAKYNNEDDKVITDYTYSPITPLTTDINEIIISYTENGITKQVKQPITVTSNLVTIYIGGSGSENEQEDPTEEDINHMTPVQIENPKTNLVGKHVFTIVTGDDEKGGEYPSVALPKTYNVTNIDTEDGAFPSTVATVTGTGDYNLFYASDSMTDTRPNGQKFQFTIVEV